MIYAVKHNKVNRSLYKANEDSLTAAVFERLMYLPKELFQHIIEQALFESIPELELKNLETIEYWPNWDSEGTGNNHHVQPDVFLRMSKADLIIEAKRYDKGQQLPYQWKKEITAYNNDYGEDEKNLIFIALGGLHTEDTDVLTVGSQEHKIYKCSWTRLLEAIKDVKFRMENSFDLTHSGTGINRILEDIILCFSLYGFSTAEWLERFLPPQDIKQLGITILSKKWTN